MFTGIVEEVGTLDVREEQGDSAVLRIRARTVLQDVSLGDSIAVNGVCLSVTRFDSEEFEVGLAPETLKRTSLGILSESARRP